MGRKKHGGRQRKQSQPAPQQRMQPRPGHANMRGLDRGSAIFKVALNESQEIVTAIVRSLEGQPMPEMHRFVLSTACSAYAAGLTNGMVLGLTQGDMAQDMVNQELTGPEQAMAALMAQDFTRDYRDEVPRGAGPRLTSVPVGNDPAEDPASGSADGVLEEQPEPLVTSGYAHVEPAVHPVDGDLPKPKRAARPRTRRAAGVAASPEAGAEPVLEVS